MEEQEPLLSPSTKHSSLKPSPIKTFKTLYGAAMAFSSSPKKEEPSDNHSNLAQVLLNRRISTEADPTHQVCFYSEACGDQFIVGRRLDAMDFEPILTPNFNLNGMIQFLKSGAFWIDVCDSFFVEMSLMSKLFNIHPLTVEDIQQADTREKSEIFPNYLYICIRSFDDDPYSFTYLQPINLNILVFQDCVLSFHSRPLQHPHKVLERIQQLNVYGLHFCPDWISYALIDEVTDSFMPLLRYIEYEVDQIDELVLILKDTNEQSDMLRRIGVARKQVLLLMRLLSMKPDVLKAITKRCSDVINTPHEIMLYLSDIQDHMVTMCQNLSHYEKTLARSHSNYLAQISIDITEASNKTNDVVMKLTVLASILIPLNVITGLWGMNVKVPGQDSNGLEWFFGIVCCMILVAFSMLWIVKRHNLLTG